MGQLIDNLFAFRLLNMLVQPFTSTDAYRLGIINSNGDVLIQPKNFTSQSQKDAYSYLQRIIFTLKKLINRLPGGESQIKNLIAAYYLVRESYTNNKTTVVEEDFYRIRSLLDSGVILVEEQLDVEDFLEEMSCGCAPTNVTGAAVSTDQTVPSDRDIKKYKRRTRRKPGRSVRSMM